MERDLRISVPTLTRVEGEGALHVAVDDGVVTDLRLEIYEPPRFFEALLRGRHRDEPVDITARICGICPVAYQMSACAALEDLSGVAVTAGISDLRRLLYCGEWIQSHVLHIAFLHAPDFLGVASGLDIASAHPRLVETALELKKFGNDLVEVVGGRAIHPVNVRVGGFHRAPDAAAVSSVGERSAWAIEAAEELVRWVAGLDIPPAATDDELVSLRGDGRYPLEAGRIVSDRGLDLAVPAFGEHFEEYQSPHSTALPVRRRGGGRYLTGPLARWANNLDLIPSEVRSLAEESGIAGPVRNPFRSIVVRALEVVIAVREAARLLDGYRGLDVAAVDVPVTAGTGHGATEAPRGLLYHSYESDAAGVLGAARIVPPTAQNQDAIEADVRAVVEAHVAALGGAGSTDAVEELRHRCEMAIRNHDPCISCATHFLRLDVDER